MSGIATPPHFERCKFRGDMSSTVDSGMKWIMQNPVRRFAYFAVIWAVVYHALEFGLNHFFGWPRYGWLHDILRGIYMGAFFALFISPVRTRSVVNIDDS
jgi:hypothetical protein